VTQPLRADALFSAAREQAGLRDFGDPSFRDGLAVLLASLEGEAQLSPLGRELVEQQLASHLANRLRIEEWWRQHPELSRETIVRPLFIVGMSRSGTTALSHLLARDRRNRSLLGYEANASVPPPEAATWRRDPRFLAAQASAGALDAIDPGFRAIHHDPPDLPVECLVVMAQHFVSLHYPSMLHVPTYTRWVRRVDHAPVYRWHRRMLTLLQSRHPGRWQLKSPHHAIALPALLAEYPDARLIVTHRDPAICVASTASLVRSLAGSFSAARRERELGAEWSETLAQMAEGLIAHARAHGERSLIHVPYPLLVRDPIAAVRKIYSELREEFTPEFESALRAHVGEHVQHKYGRHRYDFESFGLARAALDERFAAYRERFGVERERGEASA
jgi:hypothetical protein